MVPTEINQFKPQFASAVLTLAIVLCLKPHKTTFLYGLFLLFYTQTKTKSKILWSISKNFPWNQIQHISQTITTPPCTLTTLFPGNHKPPTHHIPPAITGHRDKPAHIACSANATSTAKSPKRMRSGLLISIFLQITAYRLLN